MDCLLNLSVLLLGLSKLLGELLEGGEGLLQLVVDVLLPRRDLLQGFRNSWKLVGFIAVGYIGSPFINSKQPT